MPWDAATLLTPVSDDAASGPNLEFDADFGALNRAAEGKPERQSGSAVIPAEDPDWREVEALAAGLIERTRDLRVLVLLATARLSTRGLPGYAEVLALTGELLQSRWDSIHPQLDPDDDNDPIARKNTLAGLTHPRYVLRALRQLPLTTSRLARYTWHDIALAAGRIEAQPGEGKPPTIDAVRNAFIDSDRAAVAALRSAAREAAATLAAINATFDQMAGAGSGPDYDDLGKLLREIADFVDQYAPAADAAGLPAVGPDMAEAAPAAAEVAAVAAPRSAAAMTAAMLTEVGTRADAVRLLGLVIQYFRQHEPASPLPLLLDRALRLADKNFLEILRDMAPDGLMQAQNIVGVRDE
jgi:type VI secretion system protein ImpA